MPEPEREYAAEYAILTRSRYGGDPWAEQAEKYPNPDDAIDAARALLDSGAVRAAVVQGRGTPEQPTPPAEVQVWMGVAAGYSARAAFPMHQREDVEQREPATS